MNPATTVTALTAATTLATAANAQTLDYFRDLRDGGTQLNIEDQSDIDTQALPAPFAPYDFNFNAAVNGPGFDADSTASQSASFQPTALTGNGAVNINATADAGVTGSGDAVSFYNIAFTLDTPATIAIDYTITGNAGLDASSSISFGELDDGTFNAFFLDGIGNGTTINSQTYQLNPGDYAVNATALAFLNLNGAQTARNLNASFDFTLTASPIPAPATALLPAATLAAAATRRRR